MKYTLETFEKLAETMRAMPKVESTKQEMSKSEGVKFLLKEINAMQKRGYTMRMIAEIMSKNDMTISESVLKSYVQRAKAETDKTGSEKATPKKAKSGKGSDTKEPPETPPQTTTGKKSTMIEDVN